MAIWWDAVAAIAQAVLAVTVLAAFVRWTIKKYKSHQRNKWFNIVLPTLAMSILASSILKDLPDAEKAKLAQALAAASAGKE